MSFHRTEVPIVFKYTLYDLLLTNSSSAVNYLDFILDRVTITFHDRIEKSCCKAQKILGFIKKVSIWNLI